ncbi:hypothetical protein PghCCS26_55690 [Paenibacillus glycanilyticus]|uniref:Uncharacterized protein n=1 Tax=Paenibacillus glycanilyticus TaxID=126569 RepID=A0ABQ6NVA0_9BACL|nr:hypothetical protein PghCCS26_55690 [Paenibacillus glycanilyticus]
MLLGLRRTNEAKISRASRFFRVAEALVDGAIDSRAVKVVFSALQEHLVAVRSQWDTLNG